MKFSRHLIVFLAICCAFGIYASCIEPFRLVTTRWTVETGKWTGKPITIALLSDFHMIWPWMTPHHVRDIVAETNRLQPDLILLLGDYVGTHPFGLPIDPAEGLAELKSLTAPCGVFMVMGNHEFRPRGKWPEAIRQSGMNLLQNEARRVQCRGEKFWVAGLEEWWWQNADIEKTLSQVADDRPVIMAMHNPDAFAKMPARVALSVAGHTHGGQVQIPFYGAVAAVIPSQYGTRYLYGPIREDGKDLVVTSGLGMTGLPIRFLTPPEIALVILK